MPTLSLRRKKPPVDTPGVSASEGNGNGNGTGSSDNTARIASSASYASSSTVKTNSSVSGGIGVHHKLAKVFSSSSSSSRSSKKSSFLSKRNSSSHLSDFSGKGLIRSGSRKRDLKTAPSAGDRTSTGIPTTASASASTTSLNHPSTLPELGSGGPAASSSVVSLLSRMRQSFEDLRDATGIVLGSNTNTGAHNTGISSAPLTSLSRSRASTFHSMHSGDTGPSDMRSPSMFPLSAVTSPQLPNNETFNGSSHYQSAPHSRNSSVVILSPKLTSTGSPGEPPYQSTGRMASRQSSRVNSPLAIATTSSDTIPKITLDLSDHSDLISETSNALGSPILNDGSQAFTREKSPPQVTFNSLFSRSIPDLSTSTNTLMDTNQSRSLSPNDGYFVPKNGTILTSEESSQTVLDPKSSGRSTNATKHASKQSISSLGEKVRSLPVTSGSPSIEAPTSFKERLRRKTISMLFPDNDFVFSSVNESSEPRYASWQNRHSAKNADNEGDTIQFPSLPTTPSNSQSNSLLKPQRVPLMRSLSSQEVIDNTKESKSPTSSESGSLNSPDSEFSPKYRPRSKTVGSITSDYNKTMGSSTTGSTGSSGFITRPSFSSIISSKLRSESESSVLTAFNKRTTSPSPRPSFSLSTSVEPLPERLTNDGVVESVEAYLVRIKETTNVGTSLAAVLSRSDQPFHREVLQLCIDNESFAGEPLDMALRKFLMRFRLPKETQQIDRVLESFAITYHKNNPDIYIDSATTYYVVFSLVILHTDFFNKSNRYKMAKNEYVNNTEKEISPNVPKIALEVSINDVTVEPPLLSP